MRNLIDENTVCIVGSTPDFAFGNIDPIEDIAALALEHDIGCHVDSCFGSFIVPFMVEVGFPSK